MIKILKNLSKGSSITVPRLLLHIFFSLLALKSISKVNELIGLDRVKTSKTFGQIYLYIFTWKQTPYHSNQHSKSSPSLLQIPLLQNTIIYKD